MDPATGEITALVADFNQLRAFELRPGADAWTHRTLVKGFTWASAVRRNPATGGLFAAFISDTFSAKPSTVQVVTKD